MHTAGRLRTNVYVDGFNLYHALKNLKAPYLRWLDIAHLSRMFMDIHERTGEIYYFSALATHIEKEKVDRHRAYIQALESTGVCFVAGHFKRKDIFHEGKKIRRHEEKESDVNLALHVVCDAIHMRCDKMLIITNDTDITPAIRIAREQNPRLRINVLTPPTFKPNISLWQATGQKSPKRILEQHVVLSRLPESINLENGVILDVPDKFALPSTLKRRNAL